MKFSRRDLVVYGLMAVVAVAFLWWQNGGADTIADSVGESSVVADPTRAEETLETGGITIRSDRVSDLPTIRVGQLPAEALDTLELIETDGPFPFDRDGITFQNREGLLPDRDRGYYEEYTVITPGLDHRGARRIVAGDDGEKYYTSDHYDSFSEIEP